MNTPAPGQFDDRERLTQALREQGADAAETAAWLPVVQRLADWPARTPGPDDTQRLVAALARLLPAPSPVREAIREHVQQQGMGVRWLLALARAQVSLFGLAFWLVSALITVVGAAVVLSDLPANQTLLLSVSGPFLAFLGALIAFRGTQRRVLEFELVCLPSPAQLAVARLVVVLGYDVGLGLALSLMLWAGGSAQALDLTLSWLMPLLLVAGLALVLSLRFATQTAATAAYGIWLALLTLAKAGPLSAFVLAPLAETLLGGLGVALLALALLRLQTNMHRLLPRP